MIGDLRLISIELDPYGEKMRLQRCHVGRPIERVDEDDVARALGPASTAWLLLSKLAAIDGLTVEHGETESIICYRGHRLGGLDRVKGHWFVSETLGTYTVDAFLRRLNFQLEHGRFGSSPQRWYQVDVSRVPEFEHAISELAKAIDRQLREP